MWHGRHHSAQKSTITGLELLAASTSVSKFPSVTAGIELSAMFFFSAAGHSAPAYFSFFSLIRCCSRFLVSPGLSRTFRGLARSLRDLSRLLAGLDGGLRGFSCSPAWFP